jgi:hypothetical protein
MGRNVFVLELNNDVYEEVVKPLLEKFKFDLEPIFFLDLTQICHLKRELKSILIVTKLTFNHH